MRYGLLSGMIAESLVHGQILQQLQSATVVLYGDVASSASHTPHVKLPHLFDTRQCSFFSKSLHEAWLIPSLGPTAWPAKGREKHTDTQSSATATVDGSCFPSPIGPLIGIRSSDAGEAHRYPSGLQIRPHLSTVNGDNGGNSKNGTLMIRSRFAGSSTVSLLTMVRGQGQANKVTDDRHLSVEFDPLTLSPLFSLSRLSTSWPTLRVPGVAMVPTGPRRPLW